MPEQATGETPTTEPKTDLKPLDIEAWLKAQPAEIAAALEDRTKGLKTALDTERETRKAQEKQLRDLAKRAESGSEAQKQLIDLADQIAVRDRQMEFYAEAHKLGVADLKLAWLAAQSDDLIDSKGRTNFDQLKTLHPQLFGVTTQPRGNAGVGTGGPATGKVDMNRLIRIKAGRA